jgi:glycosyltransferase involved in cell wall biosynthesis
MNTEQHPKLFFDISALLDHVELRSQFSGIQRVVAMVPKAVATHIPIENIYVSYLDNFNDSYMCLPLSQLGPDTLNDAPMLKMLLGPGTAHKHSNSITRKYRNRRLKLRYNTIRLHLSTLFGNDKPFERIGTTRPEWEQYRKKNSLLFPPQFTRDHQGSLRSKGLKFADVVGPGDHFFQIDSTWGKHVWKEFANIKKMGVTFHTWVYDLIPIVMPEATSGKQKFFKQFKKWLLRSTKYTDNYISISDATKRDLDSFLKENNVERSSRVARLAQEGWKGRKSDAPPAPVGDVSAEVAEVCAGPFVLCVGTIEVRKNIARLARAWQVLAERMPGKVPTLVFAGLRGWHREEWDAFLEETNNVNGLVKVIDGPTDAELDRMYRQCMFVTMVSIYEGWGLPVGEALSYGKTGVVADATSLPEVGGDLVRYCDPYSVDSIADVCAQMITDDAGRVALETKIATTKLRSWDDVGRDVLKAIDAA